MPAGVITTGNHPKALWPGMHAFFGAEYRQHPEEFREIFMVENSSKNYEEDTKLTGFGVAQTMPPGEGVTYDSESQGYTKRYSHTVYGLGYIVTQEELEDNLYEKVSKRRIRRLARSMRITKERVSANVLNRAFNSSYAGGDAKELLATDHPSLNGDFSNELTTAADFSQAALEDLSIQIETAVGERGLQIALRPMKLVGPANLRFEFVRVLQSQNESGTANNDVNAVKGLLANGFVINHYLTDTDAWFVKTDCPNGLTMFNRRELTFTRDNDFDTDNAKAKATMRFSVGWTDPLSIFGSPGT